MHLIFKAKHCVLQPLGQQWRTYSTRAQNDTCRSLLSQYFYSIRPTHVCILCTICVYIHTYLTMYRLYMNYRCYQITPQWHIFTQIGAVRSFHWKFDTWMPVWRWMGQNLTSDRTFCNPCCKPLTTAPKREPDELPLASTKTVAVFLKTLYLAAHCSYVLTNTCRS